MTTNEPTAVERVTIGILRDIEGGAFPPGAALPSVAELADHYGVSAATARNAMDRLSVLGHVETFPGRTATVPIARPKVTRKGDRHGYEKKRATIWDPEKRGATGATEYDTGLERQQLDLPAEYEQVNLSMELAAVFGVPAGAEALQRRYSSRLVDGPPIVMSVSHLLMADIGNYPPLLDQANEPWPGATMHQLREVGIEIETVDETIGARRPTIAEGKRLELAPGAIVITVRKIMTDTLGHVVEVADITYPAESAELAYSCKLRRWTHSHNDDVDASMRAGRRGRR
jgi:GntR family transcriptional regulator